MTTTPQDHFTISSEFKDIVSTASKEWTKRHEKSRKYCMAIAKLWQEEHQTKMPDYQQPSMELDFLPKIHEPLTKDKLKQLGEKDLVRTYKMMHYNLSVMKQYLDSHEDRRVLLDK